jgi:hypothetical protein
MRRPDELFLEENRKVYVALSDSLDHTERCVGTDRSGQGIADKLHLSLSLSVAERYQLNSETSHA